MEYVVPKKRGSNNWLFPLFRRWKEGQVFHDVTAGGLFLAPLQAMEGVPVDSILLFHLLAVPGDSVNSIPTYFSTYSYIKLAVPGDSVNSIQYLLLLHLLLHQAGCSRGLRKFNTYLLLHLLLLHLSCCSWGHSSVKTSLPIPSACWMFLATQ